MIYVASSWRNEHQPRVVEILRGAAHDVYDFRHPEPGDDGFSWGDIAENWKGWTTEEYVKALDDPIAIGGFGMDYRAMRRCSTCVLVLPCGRSAHLEAGWFAGRDKALIIYIPEIVEPELMYKMADAIVWNENDLIDEARRDAS
jgi:hypothetical protein